jgi:hypothetical protein
MRSYSPTADANVSDSGTNSSRKTRTGPEAEEGAGADVQARAKTMTNAESGMQNADERHRGAHAFDPHSAFRIRANLNSP